MTKRWQWVSFIVALALLPVVFIYALCEGGNHAVIEFYALFGSLALACLALIMVVALRRRNR